MENPAPSSLLDTRARQRLTGAAILIAVVVIAVPEVLRGPIQAPRTAARVEEPSRSIRHQEPAEPPAGLRPAAAQAAGTATPAPPAALPAGPPAPPPAPVPVVAAPREAAPPAPSHAGRNWIVQLGSFESREHAQALQQRLVAEGFQAQLAATLVTGQMLYRVRTVPASDRQSAEQLQERLQAAGHSGVVQQR